jgi:monoamine oxidase
MSDRFDAIVVGGGFAGLRAARDLRDAGHSDVVVLEARDRLGGRTLTRTFPGSDQRIELGGAWVSPRLHPLIADEMKRYGLRLAHHEEGRAPSFRWRFDGATLDGFPVAGDELYDLERALFRIIDDSHRIDPTVPRDRQNLADLDVSVEEYLTRLAVGKRTYDFLAVWAALGSGATPSEWSALSALSLIAASGFSAYAWYGAVTEKFERGTRSFIESVLADAKPTVRLDTTVARVQHDDGGVTVTTAAGERLSAPVAVIAVPLNLLREITFEPELSEPKARAAREGQPNRIRKGWILIEGAPENTIFIGPGNDLLWISPEYEIRDATLMVAFTAPPSTLDMADQAAVQRAVDQHIPGARVLGVDAHDWIADPYSKGGWPAHPPGRLSRDSSSLQRPEGRLCFAGADLATCWIGWLEGALETGARAAVDAATIIARGSGQPVGAR